MAAGVDYVADIAVTLESFFKGLSDCGLLTTYTVELQSRAIDISLKQKFSLVVNEFMANLRLLLLKFSKPADEAGSISLKDDIIPLMELINQELNINGVIDVDDPSDVSLTNSSQAQQLEDSIDTENYLNAASINPGNTNTNGCFNNNSTRPDVQPSVTESFPSLDSSALDTKCSTVKSKKRSRSECMSENVEVSEVITKYKQELGWQCDLCVETFKTMSRLEEHCRDEHAGRGCFECNFCGLRLMTKTTLTRHIKLHLTKNEGTCSICNRNFSRLDNLSNHYKNHVGQVLYKCKICNKRYNSRALFDIHEKTHTDQTGYTCHRCNKSFKRKDKLKDHIMRHLKIKRFVCHFCNKSYVEKRDLRSHLTLHEDLFI